LAQSFLTVIAVLLRILSNPLGNVFQKQLTVRNISPFTVNFLTYLVLSFFCLFFIAGISWTQLPPDFWIYSVAGGLAGSIGNGFLVKALQLGELSVLGPVNSYKSVVGLIIGIFLLGEIPSASGFLGIALIIYGSYFVLDTTNEKFSMALFGRKEIRYRMIAMVLTAIEAVFVKKVILASTAFISFISWCFSGAIFSFLLLLLFPGDLKSSIKHLTPKDAWLLLFLVVCIGTMQYTTNYTFARLQVGYALSLFQLSSLVSVWLGYRVFKEKEIRKKIVGAAIMIAGSVVIILF
jgi:drug/metabolite transporter (DMT)-like permease